MEGNVYFYQVNLVSRITGEGGAEFSRTWGGGFDQKRAGLEGGGGGGKAGGFVHVSYKSFQGDKSDGFGKKKEGIINSRVLVR